MRSATHLSLPVCGLSSFGFPRSDLCLLLFWHRISLGLFWLWIMSLPCYFWVLIVGKCYTWVLIVGNIVVHSRHVCVHWCDCQSDCGRNVLVWLANIFALFLMANSLIFVSMWLWAVCCIGVIAGFLSVHDCGLFVGLLWLQAFFL